jgi:hypothetical protein
MNRQYRRKLEKEREKEYKLFLKKNKDFLDSIKGEEGTQQTMQKIKALLDNYGKQEQTLEGGQEALQEDQERIGA